MLTQSGNSLDECAEMWTEFAPGTKWLTDSEMRMPYPNMRAFTWSRDDAAMRSLLVERLTTMTDRYPTSELREESDPDGARLGPWLHPEHYVHPDTPGLGVAQWYPDHFDLILCALTRRGPSRSVEPNLPPELDIGPWWINGPNFYTNGSNVVSIEHTMAALELALRWIAHSHSQGEIHTHMMISQGHGRPFARAFNKIMNHRASTGNPSAYLAGYHWKAVPTFTELPYGHSEDGENMIDVVSIVG